MNAFILPPYGRKESFNLIRDILLSDEFSHPVIVEIGMTRNIGNWLGDGYSTPFFSYLANMRMGELYSIDIDPGVRITCKAILDKYGLYTDRTHLIVEDGISCLTKWHDAVGKPIDLLYLDGLDYSEGPQATVSEEFHLRAFRVIENDLSPRALILIDDVYDTTTFKGKGRLVIPYIMERGYKPLYLGYQCLFSRSELNANFSARPQTENVLDEITREARAESLRAGTMDLPSNFGDVLLQNEARDARTRAMLASKRADGVRDDDIRWWWNMNDIQRRTTVKIDLRHKKNEIRKLIEEYGFPEELANMTVRKTQPVFGVSDESSKIEGDDSPLPYELMRRINEYIKDSQSDPDNFKNALKSSSTLNALIRKAIKEGRL